MFDNIEMETDIATYAQPTYGTIINVLYFSMFINISLFHSLLIPKKCFTQLGRKFKAG